MKKRLLVVVLFLMVSTLFYACNNPEKKDKANTEDEETHEHEDVQKEKQHEEKSLLSIVGVYYGKVYENQRERDFADQNLKGYEDCIVVFDYNNDEKNRTMPKSRLNKDSFYGEGFLSEEVTLCINGENTYGSYDPNGNAGHYSNNLSRYIPYKNPIGYGNLLGGADAVRMYAVFYVNPKELYKEATAKLTIQDQSVEFSFENIKEIEYADEIMCTEDDYEEQQQLAAFKWRMDKMYDLMGELSRIWGPSDDYDALGKSINNLFSSKYGVSVTGLIGDGFLPDYTYPGMNKKLFKLDADKVITAYPEQEDDVKSFIKTSQKIGRAIYNLKYSRSDILGLLEKNAHCYGRLCEAFDMEKYEN